MAVSWSREYYFLVKLVWIFSLFSAGYSELEDVAAGRGQFATQIGDWKNFTTAVKALDGDTNADRDTGSCAQPHDDSKQANAWWMVDLGSQYAIHRVVIYSEDSGSNNVALGYISVRVSDNEDIAYHTQSDQCALWNNRTFPKESSQTLECDPVRYGRYVSIQRTGGDHTYNMILCEVKVMGTNAYNTLCDNCRDEPCVQTEPCNECKARFKPPECREPCDSGDYGINCAEQCSDGCEETCDNVSGECSCKDWWDGDKCTSEVGEYKLPRRAVTFSNETDSSAVVTWTTIRDLPDNMKQYYSYVLEYRLKGQSEWTVDRTLAHDPDADDTQHHTLTGLAYNTVYKVQVWSVRSLRGQTETTEYTPDAELTTKCKAPTKPRDVVIAFEETNRTVTLSITWKHPEIVGCNNIDDYDIWYRPTSSASDDWKVIEGLSASSTSYTLRDLDSGDYVVRVVVTNDDDLSSFTELFYGPDTTTTVTPAQPSKSPRDGSNSSSIGLIVGAVVGVLLLVILLAIMAFILYRRRRHRGFYQENCKSTEELDPPSSDNEELETSSYEETSEEPTTKRKKTPLLPISPRGFVSRIQKQKAETVKAEASKKPAIPAKPSIPSVIEEEDAPTRTSVNEIVEVDEDVEEVVDQTDIEETADQTDIEETADPTEDEETPEDEEALTPDQIVDTRIRLDCLAPYIKDKRNETDGFKKEYILLKKELQYPCIEGQKEEHRLLKNRYRNIVAYDHSRVVLDFLDDDPDSSYINASYMPGYKDEVNEYIACQGPKLDTINDTWRMIWQLNSNCIVMVTNLTENAAVKCEQYWPDDGETEEYGDITVDTLQSEAYADYTERIFQAEKEGETRTIHQFHFTSWIDRGVPEHVFPLLHFRRKVVAFNRQRTGPMMVHCSAGVGRTGTFIAIDYLAKEAEAEGHVDVHRCVEQMREQRPNMVQTLAQYIFVYESVLELTDIGNTAIQCDKLAGEFEDLSSDAGDYANVSKLQQQFELLNQRRVVPVDDEIAGLQAENKPKNRCLNIVPSDRYRPYLATWQGQSDYINAAYIDGYRTRHTYIVTQTPMPDTLTDFWRLVFEHNCGTIVMMENVDDSDQTVATYWPELVGNKQENGPLTIELLEEDTSRQPGLVTRDFQLAPSKKAKKPPVKVKQFQLTAWDSDDELTSDLQEQFLKLLEQLESWQREADKGPILVHCVNGASRSGLFCAANYLIDMIKTEQEVDVFYVVRHIRAHRPQLIDSLEQYKFLHQLALTYMARSNVYQNVMAAGN